VLLGTIIIGKKEGDAEKDILLVKLYKYVTSPEVIAEDQDTIERSVLDILTEAVVTSVSFAECVDTCVDEPVDEPVRESVLDELIEEESVFIVEKLADRLSKEGNADTVEPAI